MDLPHNRGQKIATGLLLVALCVVLAYASRRSGLHAPNPAVRLRLNNTVDRDPRRYYNSGFHLHRLSAIADRLS